MFGGTAGIEKTLPKTNQSELAPGWRRKLAVAENGRLRPFGPSTSARKPGDQGLSGISVCMNTFWLLKFHKYGWRVRPLGMPDVHDDEWLIAVLIDVTPAALAGIRTACGLEHRSALVRRGPQRAFIPSRHDVAAVA
jgi:hypothetical protein